MLAVIDPRPYEVALETAKANLGRSKADYAGDADGHDCVECVPVYHRAEGILPAAGYGAHLRRPGRREQDISFNALHDKMNDYVSIIRKDPAIENIISFAGSSTTANNAGRMFMTLKPLNKRDVSSDGMIARLRPKLAQVPGASLFLQSSQELQIGGRLSNAQYQYTLQSDNLGAAERLGAAAAGQDADLAAVEGGQQRSADPRVGDGCDGGSRRGGAAGRELEMVDNALYSAFGQSLISIIYRPLNQYRVVLEMDPRLNHSPDVLDTVRVKSSTGATVPLAAFAKFGPSSTPLSVNHQGLFPAITVSFNLPRESRWAKRRASSSRRSAISECLR